MLKLQVGSRKSFGDGKSMNTKPMHIDEFVALVHLLNLVVSNSPEMALNCIQKQQLSKLSRCSNMFKGNLARIHALCLQLKVQHEATDDKEL